MKLAIFFLAWKENFESLKVSNKVGGRKVLEGKLSDSKKLLFRLGIVVPWITAQQDGR